MRIVSPATEKKTVSELTTAAALKASPRTPPDLKAQRRAKYL
jgi:hypothetical protein